MNPVHLALGAAIVVLAVVGLCWVLARVADGLERAWDWWRDRRRGGRPAGISDDCWYDAHEDCDGCECDCCDCLSPLEDLPPERSREELGFTGPQPAVRRPASMLQPFTFNDDLAPRRERRAPWWEAEARSAYQALDLDYPSGLLARVREAGQ